MPILPEVFIPLFKNFLQEYRDEVIAITEMLDSGAYCETFEAVMQQIEEHADTPLPTSKELYNEEEHPQNGWAMWVRFNRIPREDWDKTLDAMGNIKNLGALGLWIPVMESKHYKKLNGIMGN